MRDSPSSSGTEGDIVVHVDGLRKKRRDEQVLDGLSFDIRSGSVFGLIGPNGAGKTTTIKILLGLLQSDSGRVEIFGEAPMELSIANRQRIGYLSEEDHSGLADLPIAELLEYHSHFFEEWDWEGCRELIDRIGVVQDRTLYSMSKGERRKAELVIALAHRPDLLILDDPAIGLDATVRRDILWAALEAAKDEGCAILFTSHILQDVERIVDDILILDQGKVRQQGSLEDLKTRTKRLVFRKTSAGTARFPGEIERQRHGSDLVVVTDRFSDVLLDELRRDHPRLEVEDMNLEEIFCAVVGTATHSEEDAGK